VTKYIVGLFAALALATVAIAAEPPSGPIQLPAKNGNITFEHAKHKQLKCDTCHTSMEGGKIEGFGKDKAHGTCIECHKKEGKGPQKCAECHKKA